jgi:hypothetical protein
MSEDQPDPLHIRRRPSLHEATLVLAFSGWMDGGDVSTGTEPIAEIDAEPFYIYNFPGSMDVAALFRPRIKVEGGLIKTIDMPANTFYCHEAARLVLFVGKEPNLQWRTFGDCVFRLAHDVGVRRILFVGSFGGAVPHTREPRMYVSCSEARLLGEMEKYGLRRSDYEGPGSFTSYLMAESKGAGFEMVSLAAEIPGYLQGTNPLSIEAVTRRLAKILGLPLDLASLRTASTAWELELTAAIEKNEELAQEVRRLEDQYDDELLERNEEES